MKFGNYNADLDLKSPKSKKPWIIIGICVVLGLAAAGIHSYIKDEYMNYGSTHYDEGELITGLEVKDTTKDSKAKEVSIDEMYAYYKEGNETLYYGVMLTNTSDDEIYSYPKIKVTARDEDGEIIDTEEMYIQSIHPQGTSYSTDIMYGIEEPASVEFKYSGTSQYEEGEPADWDALFPISKTKHEINEYGSASFKGEVKNTTDKDASMDIFAVLRRKGKISSIHYTYETVEAGDTLPFEIYDYDIPGFDEIEYHVSSVVYQ